MEIDEKTVFEKLSCPCDSVKRLQEETNDSKVTMAKIEQKLETLCESMAELKADIRDMKENSPTNERFAQLEKRVEDLEIKPATRWNGLIDTLIGAIVGGIVTFVFIKLGLK